MTFVFAVVLALVLAAAWFGVCWAVHLAVVHARAGGR